MKRSLTDAAEEAIHAGTLDTDEQQMLQHDDEYVRLKSRLPAGVNIEDALEYGFFEHKHRYWIRRREDTFEPVSNFTMRVLYLIVGANPKRIVEITNVYRKRATLDFGIEDLISLEKFKARVEGVGNFLFEGKAQDLARIKSKLYNLEKPSLEIARLGQYKNKFFAFANGIYTGDTFLPVDDKGMVAVGDENYYIPVFGDTKADDDDDLRNYRRFLHRESAVTFREWADLFCQVYGENGKLGISFFLFTLFSDAIFDRTKAAPMLFLFGQRGSGKGTMANSLLHLFGEPQDPLMLGGASTVVGFMRKLGQFQNALVWLDEYKNDIGEKKIESLKNIWDRVGYERGVKDQSNRTQTTSVTSSAIISGQEIPNVEPALFSRTVLCEFRAMQRGADEIVRFNALRTMEQGGITNVTLECLSLRPLLLERFYKSFTEIAASLRTAFADEDVIERQVINFAILAACVQCLEDRLHFPFHSSELLQISERFIKRQRDMMSTANEVQQFFEMVAFLLSNGLIKDGRDVHISDGVVKIRMVSVFPLYREYARRQGSKPLDRGTLGNYMENSQAFMKKESKQGSHRFPLLQNPTNCIVFLQGEIAKLYGVNFSEMLQEADNQPVTAKTLPDLPF